MTRYLVVANQSLTSEHLLDFIADHTSAESCSFMLVVPATPPPDQAFWTEGAARALARGRLDAALDRMRSMGAHVTGSVGDQSPVQAVADALLRDEYDELVVSTLPPGISRWLLQDLPHRLSRSTGLPVTHVAAGRDGGVVRRYEARHPETAGR